jgi:hypothetical protein
MYWPDVVSYVKLLPPRSRCFIDSRLEKAGELLTAGCPYGRVPAARVLVAFADDLAVVVDE